MNSFEKALLRLKEQLGVQTDKEIAELLGMTTTAFNARKKRDSFPEDKLLALVAKRPDLYLNAEYVLMGKSSIEEAYRGAAQVIEQAKRESQRDFPSSYPGATQSNAATSRNLTADEQELLALFRAANLAQKMEAVAVLSAAAKKKPAPKPKPVAQESGIKISGSGHRVAGRDYHEKE